MKEEEINKDERDERDNKEKKQESKLSKLLTLDFGHFCRSDIIGINF